MYDQYGRWVPDNSRYTGYNPNFTGYNPNQFTGYDPTNHREDLLKQREALDYRLSEIDKRYPPPTQSQPQQPTQEQAPPAPQQPFIVVSNEKEAREYPIVNRIDDDIGKVHIFVTSDEKTMIAKRINPGTFDSEIEIYDKRDSEVYISENDDKSGLLESIDTRLQKIEGLIDNFLPILFSDKPTNKRVKHIPIEEKKEEGDA